MARDSSEGGRPQRGIIVFVEGPDRDRTDGQAELVRRMTAMADYVLHVEDAAAGDEALDFLMQLAWGGGQQSLRGALDDLADREAGRRRGTERSLRTADREGRTPVRMPAALLSEGDPLIDVTLTERG